MARKFYAQKDALGFPIPSTMMSTEHSIPADSIEIPAANVAAGVGEVVVPHPDKLRYFVRRTADGKIIPNSLMITYKKPEGLVYEFKKVVAS